MANKEQIAEMTAAALANYEFSCEWAKAFDAAREEAQELGIKPTRSEILEAVKIAQTEWHAITIKTKNAIKL